ncbi:MAG TPA: response regulator transcription factor [Fulvivirga sp.]|nr:response regulator transcription factor [Fulvivirga sp.]
MEKIKVILVDDHLLLLEGIASMLQNIEYIKIVGKASSGEEAINLVNELTPDIVLMDIVMQGMTGIEATKWIKEQNDTIKIIILTSEVNEKYVSLAIKAGVDGYLPKNVEKPILIEAINKVNAGERYFSQSISSIMLDSFYKQESGETKSAVNSDLTKREFEILKQVALGKSNQEVADELFISIKTVETHKTNILSKLGLRNTVELVRYAIKNKVIEL